MRSAQAHAQSGDVAYGAGGSIEGNSGIVLAVVVVAVGILAFVIFKFMGKRN
jgi:hypothetical protein